jgi:hypothetical protein
MLKILSSFLTLFAFLGSDSMVSQAAGPTEDEQKISAPGQAVTNDYSWIVTQCAISLNAVVRYIAMQDTLVDSTNLSAFTAGLIPVVSDFEEKVAVLRAAPPPDERFLSIHKVLVRQVDSLVQLLRRLTDAFQGGDRNAVGKLIVECNYAIRSLQDTYRSIAELAEVVNNKGSSELRSSEAGMNNLTNAVIQPGGKINFLGVMDSAGPQAPIPYATLLATALQLPPESGPLGPQGLFIIGSVPGFSLELREEMGPTWAETHGDKYRKVVEEHSHIERDPEQQRYNFAQMKKEWIESIQEFLATRMDPTVAASWTNQIRNREDYDRVVNQLESEGVTGLRKFLTDRLIRRMTSAGNIFVLDQSWAEKTFGKTLQVEPVFFGIPPHSQLARIVMEGDYALKSLASARGIFLKTQLPFHQVLGEWIMSKPFVMNLPIGGWQFIGGIQAMPKHIVLSVSSGGSVVSFPTAEMMIGYAHRGLNNNNELQTGPAAVELDNAFRSYAEFLSSHLEEYTTHTPELWRLREAYKVVALARYLQKQRIAPDLPTDSSWTPPSRLKGTFDAVSIGTGDSMELHYFPSGGVNLQIEASHALDIRENQRGPDPRQLLDASADRAAGYPIATDPAELAQLDPADVKANLSNMTPVQIKTLADKVHAREERLVTTIAEVRKRETAMMYKAASPPDLPTFQDRVKDVLAEEIPGVQHAAELGQRTAQQLLDIQKSGQKISPETQSMGKELAQSAEDLVKFRQLWKTAANLSDGTTRQTLATLVGAKPSADLTELASKAIEQASHLQSLDRLIKKGTHLAVRSEDALVEATVTAELELGLSAVKFAVAHSWDEVPSVAEHLGNAVRAVPISGEFAAVAVRNFKIAEVTIVLTHQMADAYVMGRAARHDAATNRLLQVDLALKRSELEGQLRTARGLEKLIQEQIPK